MVLASNQSESLIPLQPCDAGSTFCDFKTASIISLAERGEGTVPATAQKNLLISINL